MYGPRLDPNSNGVYRLSWIRDGLPPYQVKSRQCKGEDVTACSNSYKLLRVD